MFSANTIFREQVRAIAFHLRRRRSAMIELLRRLVELESPSTEKAALDRLSMLVASEWRRQGAEVLLLRRSSRGDLVRAVLPAVRDADRPHVLGKYGVSSSPGAEKQVLVLGHLDTVYPLGTLARMPFRVARGRAFGPGVYDMKAGLVMALFAVDALRRAEISHSKRVVFLWTTDEEIGSAASLSEIEREAARSAAVLVLEPSLGPRGLLKTARKGVGEVELRIHGKSAHAGVNPAAGVNAVHELALQLARMASWSEPAHGLFVAPTVASGGLFSNVIPDFATGRADIRFSRAKDAQILSARLRSLAPILKGAKLEVRGGINRPPLVRDAGVGGLFRHARKIGRMLGLDLREGSTGGGSDGNFTAALGVPTLDGLGAVGEGAHTPGESIVLRALPERIALLAGLLASL
jgi:glutamate carboxypeptidase